MDDAHHRPSNVSSASYDDASYDDPEASGRDGGGARSPSAKSTVSQAPSTLSSPIHVDSASQADDDDMITVRAHNKKTGEITIMRVRKGTPMKEVMSKYAQNKGVKVDKLSVPSNNGASVSVVGTIPGANGGKQYHTGVPRIRPPEVKSQTPLEPCASSEDLARDCGYSDCGCTGYANV